jgi:hypothetical protein
MRLIQHIFLLFFATVAAAAAARAADNGQTNLAPKSRDDNRAATERVSLQAILVIASDEGTTDSSLAAHEATLRRVLRFKSYRRIGGGATGSLAANGEETIAIGAGYNLDIWIKWMTDREVDFGVRGFKGKLTVANNTMTRPRRSTAVIGGWAAEDGKSRYLVILTVN